jgi:hypothetical protein
VKQASRAAASTSPTTDSGSRKRFHFSPVAMVSTPRTAPVVDREVLTAADEIRDGQPVSRVSSIGL